MKYNIFDAEIGFVMARGLRQRRKRWSPIDGGEPSPSDYFFCVNSKHLIVHFALSCTVDCSDKFILCTVLDHLPLLIDNFHVEYVWQKERKRISSER